jgi:hypothetical protein
MSSTPSIRSIKRPVVLSADGAKPTPQLPNTMVAPCQEDGARTGSQVA